MKAFYILFVFSFITISLTAQKIQQSLSDESIAISDLQGHLSFLASDDLEGRLPGTSGYSKAAEYAASQFMKAGLSPIPKLSNSKHAYYQNISLNEYSTTTNSRITIIKDKSEYTYSPLNYYHLSALESFESKELSGKLVFAGAGIKEPDYGVDDFKNIDTKGKWIIILSPMYQIPNDIKNKLPVGILKKYQNSYEEKRDIIVQNAMDAGAIGILCMYYFKTRPGFDVRNYFTVLNSEKKSSSVHYPFIVIDSLIVANLFQHEKIYPKLNQEVYQSFELKNTKLKLRDEFKHSKTQSENIVALIEGNDPILKNEYITLGAHLDHLGTEKKQMMNGADDNASGCAGVIEIAKALEKSHPKRSVICILYTGEEYGFFGSKYFLEHPPVSLKNIFVNINLDMIGRPDGNANDLGVIGSDKISPKLKNIIFNVNAQTSKLKLDTTNYSNIFSRSDQISYYRKKIPSVIFFTGFHKDWHTPFDDVKMIDFDFLRKTCNLTYNVIFELANSDEQLKND